MWDRVARDVNGNVVGVDDATGVWFPGYQQNWFPMSPNDSGGTTSKCVLVDTTKPPGGFFKYTQWTRQSERALLFESIVDHNWGAGSTWPFAPTTATPFPKTPSGGVANFPIDFNRHGRYRSGNKQNDPSLNVLFCDGHADLLSCRQAWTAIRFN
jgi:prepilin-type processing-associated H-X9-DG protein